MYERVLAPWRHRPIAFVEVGVQNGGSLELWARYLPRATVLVGCDIDPKCAALAFDDARIKIVVGDVNSEPAYREIRAHAPTFDVFIDDGSHTSRDIVLSFCNYFRHVNAGGIYVVEDLHCSYLTGWGGGIDRGDTSMEFLKLLADFVNQPYWQRDRAPLALLAPFFPSGSRPDLTTFRDIRLGHVLRLDVRGREARARSRRRTRRARGRRRGRGRVDRPAGAQDHATVVTVPGRAIGAPHGADQRGAQPPFVVVSAGHGVPDRLRHGRREMTAMHVRPFAPP